MEHFRNAGVFTAEEIVTIARDRLIRLHALHFQYVTLLKEKYRLRRAFYRKRIEEETKNGASFIFNETYHLLATF